MGRYRVQMDQQAVAHIVAVLTKKVMADADALLEKLSTERDEEDLEAHSDYVHYNGVKDARDLGETIRMMQVVFGLGLTSVHPFDCTAFLAGVPRFAGFFTSIPARFSR